jgi:hypothetical protein
MRSDRQLHGATYFAPDGAKNELVGLILQSNGVQCAREKFGFLSKWFMRMTSLRIQEVMATSGFFSGGAHAQIKLFEDAAPTALPVGVRAGSRSHNAGSEFNWRRQFGYQTGIRSGWVGGGKAPALYALAVARATVDKTSVTPP